MPDFPKIVSVDDHVIEPPSLWQDRLPARFRAEGPRVERHACTHMGYVGGRFSFELGDEGTPCDWWRFEKLMIPRTRVESAIGYDRADVTVSPTTYDEMRPGCYDPAARLVDMDEAHIEAQLCFPSTFPRFCGQTFSEAADKDLGLACIQAYNDWMVEEWCGDSGGRLVPLVIVPLWDAELAAREVRRNADRGVRAVTFSEIPAHLGLPSIHTDFWVLLTLPWVGHGAVRERTPSASYVSGCLRARIEEAERGARTERMAAGLWARTHGGRGGHLR